MKIPTERDGEWIDDLGCCKVCDGEIPHGHTDQCDIFKLEQRIRLLEDVSKELYESLNHTRHCADCAEDNWQHCDGGREAEEAMKKWEKMK
jgi:hypothetical protein